MSNVLLTLASRALWCVGMALLLLGTLLASEGSAFADPGDPVWCRENCAQYSTTAQQYDACAHACMGENYNSIDCYWCVKPTIECPASTGGCVNSRYCTGVLCPTWKCFCANLYPSGCECRSTFW